MSKPVTGSRPRMPTIPHIRAAALFSLVARVYISDDDVSAVNAAQRKSTYVSTCVGGQASDLRGCRKIPV